MKFLLAFYIILYLLMPFTSIGLGFGFDPGEDSAESYVYNAKIIDLLDRENMRVPLTLREAGRLYNLKIHYMRYFFPPGTGLNQMQAALFPPPHRPGVVYGSSKDGKIINHIIKCIAVSETPPDGEKVIRQFIAKYGDPYVTYGASALYFIKKGNQYLKFTATVNKRLLLYDLEDMTAIVVRNMRHELDSKRATDAFKNSF